MIKIIQHNEYFQTNGKRNTEKIYADIFKFLTLFLFLFLLPYESYTQQQRFPKPEFETGYEQPKPTTPEPRSLSMEYADVVVLVLVLILLIWFTLKNRSRRGILWVSVFSLFYFGFYRDGCICSIGAIQNISLSLFSSNYVVSLTVLAFFLIPLLISLFFGRVFCAGACPLGAIQDLVIIKPVSIPAWLQKTLGLFPYIYLGLAVLFAATGTDFIICRYDPFVGIFRMGAEFNMIILGIGFLLIGLFVARPYCRFLCPYGGLLKITSFFSRNHLSISPSECVQCKLCSNSCPFDAIEHPVEMDNKDNSRKNFKKFIRYAILLPVLILIGGYAVSKSHVFLSRAHPDVYLAELLVAHPEMKNNTENIDIKTFMSSGKSLDTLVQEARIIRDKFREGGWFLGGFIGFVLGLTLLNQVIYRKRTDYQPHKGNCFSCGRCMKYCPVKK